MLFRSVNINTISHIWPEKNLQQLKMKSKERNETWVTKFQVIQQAIFPDMKVSMEAIEKAFKKSKQQKEKRKRRKL